MHFARSRLWLATATVAAVGTTGVVTTAAAHAAGCKVTYTVTNQWQGGFGANVTIDNLGDPVSGWRLAWSFAAGQSITQLWSGTYTQSAAQVTVTNASWNGNIPTGGNVSFGFNGSWTSSNPVPASFTLNGTHCTGSIPSNPPPSTPTTAPTTSPPPTSPPPTSPPPTGTTTAWQGGRFVVDTPNVVRRSNIVFNRPGSASSQFAPLGNGTLGVAAWSANGFTAQLNRADTFPDRKSPGRVVIPGLSRLTNASDFRGHLDLYDGTLRQSGGGMSLTAYVRADTAQLVVDVTGADPNTSQTARVELWSGRTPTATASGSVATLSQTWTDNTATGASGQRFGAMAGISAGGRNVTASIPNSTTAQVNFRPNSDGSFRVIAVSPTWTGGDPIATARTLLGSDLTRSASDLAAGHLSWWHNYWATVGLIRISSGDGSGEYFENMRTLYLYNIAATNRGALPGSQAGVANLFVFDQDSQPWYPAGYWFWNTRMMVQANLSAGAFAQNTPVFNLYRTNVSNIAAWTGAHFPGREGLCVPETMRFNGNGYYGGSNAASNASCDSRIAPNYNARNVTTGAEIGLWIWQTYLTTDDRSFLSAHYPIMAGAARFLLSHATTGSDGLLHTFSNAHENQWDVNDPINDVAAMQALFPVVVSAAQTLGVDADLVSRLNSAIPKIRPLPRTDIATKSQVLTPASDAAGRNMLAMSAEPTATKHNQENVELEPVWPYNLIGDAGHLSDLAKRTFSNRSYVTGSTWSYDALHAARLGLGNDMRSAMLANIGKYQVFPNGFASWNAQPTTPYLEEQGVIAAAISEGLVQHYDGTLRVAPGWPNGWNVDGTVYIQHRGKAHVQIRNGTLTTVALESGATGTITVRNPWPGQNVTVVDSTGTIVTSTQTNGTFDFLVQAGRTYLVQLTSAPTTALPHAPVSGSAATAPKNLNGRSIGLPR
ncbi:cellulose-binding domain-containing protein [Verrucosispora sioxanthis]|uniref:cellulose-binding domain-containing protein n=1 Tax=Verrucosispora sioxanthis TaxID=2499994 RepID=UPI0028168F3C|nr:cellulose-binding domain-containing protein [Verrucosispora sioxanthis]